jgi:hypothetical protein
MNNNLYDSAQAPNEKIVVLDWRPIEKNTLVGFAKVKIVAWSLVIDGVAIHKKEGREWAQLPARPQLDKDGNALREDSGKIKYAKILEVDDKRIAWALSDAIVAAVNRKVAANA